MVQWRTQQSGDLWGKGAFPTSCLLSTLSFLFFGVADAMGPCRRWSQACELRAGQGLQGSIFMGLKIYFLKAICKADDN